MIRFLVDEEREKLFFATSGREFSCAGLPAPGCMAFMFVCAECNGGLLGEVDTMHEVVRFPLQSGFSHAEGKRTGWMDRDAGMKSSFLCIHCACSLFDSRKAALNVRSTTAAVIIRYKPISLRLDKSAVSLPDPLRDKREVRSAPQCPTASRATAGQVQSGSGSGSDAKAATSRHALQS